MAFNQCLLTVDLITASLWLSSSSTSSHSTSLLWSIKPAHVQSKAVGVANCGPSMSIHSEKFSACSSISGPFFLLRQMKSLWLQYAEQSLIFSLYSFTVLWRSVSDFSQLSGLSVVLLPIRLQGSTLLLLLQEGTVVWVLWPIKHGPSVRREQNDACVHFHLIPYRAKLLSHLTFLHIWIPRSQTFFIVPYLKVLLSSPCTWPF